MSSSDAAGHFSTPPPLLRHGASSALHVIIGRGPAFGAAARCVITTGSAKRHNDIR